MYKILEDAVYYIIHSLGYIPFLVLKDIISFLCGVGIGALIVCFMSGKFLLNIKKIDTMNKSIFVRFNDDDRDIYFTNPTTTREAIHLMALFIFSPLGKRKKFRKRDIKRTNRIIKFLLILLIVLIIISFMLVSTVILPDGDGYKIHIKDYIPFFDR